MLRLENQIIAPVPVVELGRGFLGDYVPRDDTDTARSIIAEADAAHLGGDRFRTEHWRGRVVDTPAKLRALASLLMRVDCYSFDTEFTSLKMRAPGYAHLSGLSFSWGKHNNYYVPIRHFYGDLGEFRNIPIRVFRSIMQPVFDRTDVRVVGYNLKAEMHILANEGMAIRTHDLYDCLVAFHNLYEDSHEKSLKDLSYKFYGYEQRHFDDLLTTIPKDVVKRHLEELKREHVKGALNGNASMLKIKYAALYAMDDTFWTWRIYCDIQEALQEEGIEDLFHHTQMKFLRALFAMERRGIKIDIDKLHAMTALAEEELKKLEYELVEMVGVPINVGSGEQLAQLLYGWKKKKPIYHEDIIPLGKYFKSGPRKGQEKVKIVKDKNRIVGYEVVCNEALIANSFHFPVGKTSEKGMPSTAADDLAKLLVKEYKRDKRKREGQEFIRLYLKFARLDKLKSAFMVGMLNNLYPDGRMHSSFNQTGTSSGRLSCNAVNLQQMPKPIEDEEDDAEYWKQFEIRALMVADDDDHVLLAHDFSNLEVRVATHFSQDPLLIEMFNNGYDLHGDTARNMFQLDCHPNDVKKLFKKRRNQAKVINFLLLYGGSASALAEILQVPRAEAQELFDLYFQTYKGMARMMKEDKKFVRRNLYTPTILHRKRHLEGINSPRSDISSYNERLATNAKIQGSAADIAMSAQNLIEDDAFLIERRCYALVQVHDEIVSICPKEYADECAERIQYLMENCLPGDGLQSIKLVVDYDSGKTYAEAK